MMKYYPAFSERYPIYTPLCHIVCTSICPQTFEPFLTSPSVVRAMFRGDQLSMAEHIRNSRKILSGSVMGMYHIIMAHDPD